MRFRPSEALPPYKRNPRLAPWAAFWRRYAARNFLLLGLVFAFRTGHGMLHAALSFGFVHSSLVFLCTLGTRFGTLLALFVQHLFATQKFDEGVVSAVAFAPTGANDAQITTIAVAKTRADGVEELVHGGAGHKISERLPTRGQVAALAEGNHLLDQRSHGFGLGDGGLNALFDDERGDQVAQQGAAVRRVTSQFPSSYFVAHRKILRF